MKMEESAELFEKPACEYMLKKLMCFIEEPDYVLGIMSSCRDNRDRAENIEGGSAGK